MKAGLLVLVLVVVVVLVLITKDPAVLYGLAAVLAAYRGKSTAGSSTD